MQQEIAKWIIGAGVLLVLVGGIWYFFHDKLQWIGRLPGDIRIENDRFRFYFPLTTMVLFSILINILIRVYRYFF